jgi:hypothetical protein
MPHPYFCARAGRTHQGPVQAHVRRSPDQTRPIVRAGGRIWRWRSLPADNGSSQSEFSCPVSCCKCTPTAATHAPGPATCGLFGSLTPDRRPLEKLRRRRGGCPWPQSGSERTFGVRRRRAQPSTRVLVRTPPSPAPRAAVVAHPATPACPPARARPPANSAAPERKTRRCSPTPTASSATRPRRSATEIRDTIVAADGTCSVRAACAPGPVSTGGGGDDHDQLNPLADIDRLAE